MANLIALGAGFCVLPLVVGGGMFFSGMRRDRKLAARTAALHRPAKAAAITHTPTGPNFRVLAVRMVSSLGETVLRLGMLSGSTRGQVEEMLTGAGFGGPATLRLFVGAKLLLLLILPGAMWLVTNDMDLEVSTKVIATAAAGVVGIVTPDSVIKKMRAKRMKRIDDQLPDALDMMVICAGAGLGLGTTIIRVAQELRVSHSAVALELAQTANEMQMMTDGKSSLINLGERCGVDSAKRLATTLLQSAQYGTPLTEALRALAGELRAELITRFESKAARMPVLLTLPMILFILPSVFLVIAGPAVIKVMHALS